MYSNRWRNTNCNEYKLQISVWSHQAFCVYSECIINPNTGVFNGITVISGVHQVITADVTTRPTAAARPPLTTVNVGNSRSTNPRHTAAAGRRRRARRARERRSVRRNTAVNQPRERRQVRTTQRFWASVCPSDLWPLCPQPTAVQNGALTLQAITATRRRGGRERTEADARAKTRWGEALRHTRETQGCDDSLNSTLTKSDLN